MVDVAIIGGGLAGLSAAIHLRKAGLDVFVIEKKSYPQHKVCGEYISQEVLPYFRKLDLGVEEIQPQKINRFRLYAPSGKYAEASLDLGGLGIRRYALDNYLYEHALQKGVSFQLNNPALSSVFRGEHFELKLKKGTTIEAKTVIGSFGKRSVMDKSMQRPFTATPADYVGIKYYLKKHFPADLVTLYNFEGGYCGAVQVEDGTVDLALLIKQQQFKKIGGISGLEQYLYTQHQAIADLFEGAEQVLVKPIVISNVSFVPKKQVQDHVLMVGDAAGMIPPLAGNGMAMGIHAAKLASECLIEYFEGRTDRSGMEAQYQKKWQQHFAARLYWGRWLHFFMGKTLISEYSVRILKTFPVILPPIIRQTHGKPL